VLRGVFVTGTGTGVGKTVVAAALFHRYRASRPLRYWKPVQTGIEQDDDTATVKHLTGCRPEDVLERGIRLPGLVSPHLAARLSGSIITVSELAAAVRREPEARWIVEGAGGALVPLSDSETMASLMCELALPIVIAARTDLGTINHTLLTIEALRERRLRVAGVVMVGSPDAENRAAIERYGEVRILGELPRIDPLTSEALGRWASGGLDPDAIIRECFE
jgi:dethiobiotin synthase